MISWPVFVEKIIFRIGLVPSLISIYWAVYAMKQAQRGPSWEVPPRVMALLHRMPWVCLILAGSSVAVFVIGSFFHNVRRQALVAYWVVVGLGLLLPIIIRLIHPEHWPFQYQFLSSMAGFLPTPTIVVCILVFLLVGVWWMR